MKSINVLLVLMFILTSLAWAQVLAGMGFPE